MTLKLMESAVLGGKTEKKSRFSGARIAAHHSERIAAQPLFLILYLEECAPHA